MVHGISRDAFYEADCASGAWAVFKHTPSGETEIIEGELPEEIARQMVADYAAEGETVWMERTAPAPE